MAVALEELLVGSLISNKELFEMTPNPTNGNLNIEFSTNTESKVEIFNLGKEVFSIITFLTINLN